MMLDYFLYIMWPRCFLHHHPQTTHSYLVRSIGPLTLFSLPDTLPNCYLSYIVICVLQNWKVMLVISLLFSFVFDSLECFRDCFYIQILGFAAKCNKDVFFWKYRLNGIYSHLFYISRLSTITRQECWDISRLFPIFMLLYKPWKHQRHCWW